MFLNCFIESKNDFYKFFKKGNSVVQKMRVFDTLIFYILERIKISPILFFFITPLSFLSAATLSETEKLSDYETFARGLKPRMRMDILEDRVKHIHGLFFEAWCTTLLRSGAATVKTDYGERVTANLYILLENLAGDLISKGEYANAMKLPEIFGRIAVRETHRCNISSFIDGALEYLNEQLESKFLLTLDDFLVSKSYTKSRRLAEAYLLKNAPTATIWLDRIRDEATREIEGVGRVVRSLAPFPDLQARERSRALEIMDIFPEGDVRHTQIQDHYNSILSAPIAEVSTSAALEFSRKLADTL